MYLLYLDESGQPRGILRASKTFTVAGVALHEQDCVPLAQAVDSLQARLVRECPRIEIHASAIWSGRDDWSHVPKLTRRKFLSAVLKLMGSWKAPTGRAPTYFGCVIDKKSYISRKDLISWGHENLFAKYNTFLNRLHQAGDSHRALVVADNSSYEQYIQRLVTSWRDGGSPITSLSGIIEVPLYVDSKASRLVQVADCLVKWPYGARQIECWANVSG